MPLDDRDRVRLRDMVSHARDAITLLGGKTIDEMINDLGTRHGVVRCVEVIGEAGHQVSPTVQSSLSSIP
jgi:uncharacterized protein with HEPN domain